MGFWSFECGAKSSYAVNSDFTTYGAPIYIHTATVCGPRKNKKFSGAYQFLVYMQIAHKYFSLYIHHHGGAARPVVVYIESVVFWGSLHIHQETVYTSHIRIFSRPKPGGGENKNNFQNWVCLVGKNLVDPVGVFCAI